MGDRRKELELYVHIPFCIKKCQYCDFLSAPAPEAAIQAYVDKLLEEIDVCADIYSDYQITTLFIGGGTPSLLPEGLLCSVAGHLTNRFQVQPGAEFTIECNPGTLNKRKLLSYRSCGINRLSIGLQSADEAQLRLLGRQHTYRQFLSNYWLAREVGFDNINIDLIYSIPSQTAEDYRDTLETVLALSPEHISAYSLIIEEGTPFYGRYHEAAALRREGKEQHLLPSEEEECLMDQATQELLSCGGYGRYEISNYAKSGFACRHNIGYWTRRNYLGLGLGAASLVDNTRFSNPCQLQAYLDMDVCMPTGQRPGSCPAWSIKRQQLPVAGQMEEFMFLGLRMMRGVSGVKFYRQFSVKMEDVYGDVIQRQLKQGLIKKTECGYALSEHGIQVGNVVMAEYLLG